MADRKSTSPAFGPIPVQQTPREIALKEAVKALGHELLTDNSEPPEGSDERVYYVVDRVLNKVVLTNADAADVSEWIAEHGAILDLVSRHPASQQLLGQAYRLCAQEAGADLCVTVRKLMRPHLVRGEEPNSAKGGNR